MKTETLGIAIDVSNAIPQPQLTFLEKAVVRLGGPDATRSVCNAIANVSIFLAVAYLIVGTVLIFRSHPHTIPWPMILGWPPIMFLQLIPNPLRYAALSLMMKSVESMAQVHMDAFHASVAQAVSTALAAHFEGRERPAAPTIN
jgi:hypothetical protein